MRSIEDCARSAPDRLHSRYQTFVEGRRVDQPEIVETAPGQVGQRLIDRAMDSVRTLVRPHLLRRIGGIIAKARIFELEQVYPLHDPLVVGEPLPAVHHYRPEMAVARERPVFAAWKLDKGEHAR